MNADCYIVHISHACKAMNGMSLTAFGHGSVKITVINSRELTRTDTWGSGVQMIRVSILSHILASKYAAGCACSVLFIEDILKCAVEHIAANLCFKTSYTLVMVCGRNSTTI